MKIRLFCSYRNSTLLFKFCKSKGIVRVVLQWMVRNTTGLLSVHSKYQKIHCNCVMPCKIEGHEALINIMVMKKNYDFLHQSSGELNVFIIKLYHGIFQ